MTEKSEEMGGGGGGGGEEGERESAELWIADSWRGGGGGGSDPTLEKEEGFQFQTSHRMNGKTGIPGGKNNNKKQH